MKLIRSIIQPHKLEEVKEALHSIGIAGMTVSEVKGFGRQKGHKEVYRGSEYQVSFVPKIELEIAVTDDLVDQVVKVITEKSRTGKIGDGKIFIQSLDEVIRIRTGEKGKNAL